MAVISNRVVRATVPNLGAIVHSARFHYGSSGSSILRITCCGAYFYTKAVRQNPVVSCLRCLALIFQLTEENITALHQLSWSP